MSKQVNRKCPSRNITLQFSTPCAYSEPSNFISSKFPRHAVRRITHTLRGVHYDHVTYMQIPRYCLHIIYSPNISHAVRSVISAIATGFLSITRKQPLLADRPRPACGVFSAAVISGYRCNVTDCVLSSLISVHLFGPKVVRSSGELMQSPQIISAARHITVVASRTSVAQRRPSGHGRIQLFGLGGLCPISIAHVSPYLPRIDWEAANLLWTCYGETGVMGGQVTTKMHLFGRTYPWPVGPLWIRQWQRSQRRGEWRLCQRRNDKSTTVAVVVVVVKRRVHDV